MRLLIASDLHGSLDSLRFLCDTAQRLSPAPCWKNWTA